MNMVTRSRRLSNRLGYHSPALIIPYNPAILQGKARPFSRVKHQISDLLRQAYHYSMLLNQGVVKPQAELARKEAISRNKLTRILHLLKLAPEIRDYLTSLTDPKQAEFFTEKRLREITRIKDHETQLQKFRDLRKKLETVPSKP